MAQPPPYYPAPAYGPPPGYAYAPPQVQHNVVVQQQPVYVNQQTPTITEGVANRLGGGLASAFRSGGQLVKGTGHTGTSVAKSVGRSTASIAKSGVGIIGNTAQGFKDEVDRTASSPLLNCLLPGCGIQLVSKSGKGSLRCLPNGALDGRGQLGNDYSCHWLVINRWEHKVILRNGAFPQFHLANAVGSSVGTGIGDGASTFKLHETSNHYVTLQHEMTGQFVGVDNQQNIVPAAHVTSGGDNSLFEVHLVYSPFGHIYKPVH